MKTGFVLSVLILATSSYAMADKISTNLSKLTANDICSEPVASMDLDSLEDITLSNKMIQTIRDQDILFASKFFTTQKGCSVLFDFRMRAITIKSVSENTLGYAYSYRLTLAPLISKVTLGSKTIDITVPILYDITSFGVVGTKAELDAKSIDAARQAFQDFLLDWRKAH